MLQFVIELLDDEYGITMDAFISLENVVETSDDAEKIEKLLKLVDNSEGRCFLPEGWREQFEDICAERD